MNIFITKVYFLLYIANCFHVNFITCAKSIEKSDSKEVEKNVNIETEGNLYTQNKISNRDQDGNSGDQIIEEYINPDNNVMIRVLKQNKINDIRKKTSENSKNKDKSIARTYIAAVFSFKPFKYWTEAGRGYEVLRQNSYHILEHVKDALRLEKELDIFVAPEYGVQSLHLPWKLTDFMTYTQYIPNPEDKITPCMYPTGEESDKIEAIQILSCGAREYDVYLVVALAEIVPCSIETISNAPWNYEVDSACPTDGYYFYNTQIVFDRTGTIIARYRKINLCNEDYFDVGPIDDASAIFVTDFDVTFSLQLGSDIMFEHPAYNNVKRLGIKDVATSVVWNNELPYDVAIENQYAWSRGMGVNLLTAGYHEPENYKVGLGIYFGLYDAEPFADSNESPNVVAIMLISHVNTTSLSYVNLSLSHENEKKFEVNVPESNIKTFNNQHNFKMHLKSSTHLILHQDLKPYTKILLRPGGVFHEHACSNDNFCCHLTYEYSSNLTYYFFVYSGLHSVGFGSYHLGIQQCSVVWCRNSDYKTCAVIETGFPKSDDFQLHKLSSSNFKTDVVYPVGIRREGDLISSHNLNFVSKDTYSEISSEKPINNLLTVALNGRWFAKDHSH